MAGGKTWPCDVTTFVIGWTTSGRVGNRRRSARTLLSAPCARAIIATCGRVSSGFRLLSREEIVKPSLGFAERLVRQLGELGRAPSVADFFERVGRRFVYATLVLTFLALLALAAPSTGPIRGLSAADMPAQEAALAYSDPVAENGLQESPDLAPVESPAPAVPSEVK